MKTSQTPSLLQMKARLSQMELAKGDKRLTPEQRKQAAKAYSQGRILVKLREEMGLD